MSGSNHNKSLAEKVRALRDTATYAGLCTQVEFIETHFACVFLAGEFAYKLKKPVQVERMDFRNVDARERNCREELRLNRRLSPQVYLDVVPLTSDMEGTLRLGAASATNRVIDWLVKMQRLPADRMLDRAIASGWVTVADVEPAARLLARFYRDQLPILLSGADYLARLHARVDDARDQLLAADLALDKPIVEAAHRQQFDFLLEHAALVQERALAGKIIEGHGDLRPEHVFLGSDSMAALQLSSCVIDCLEFDRDLRILDPLEELAFFSLECDRLLAALIGHKFIRIYLDNTQDEFSEPLFAFYRAQRALTRAKVAAWHTRDPDVCELADWRAQAESYLRDALSR